MGDRILCHDPEITQYGGLNVLRETHIYIYYIKGGPQLLRGQSDKDTEPRTLSYRRLYQTLPDQPGLEVGTHLRVVIIVIATITVLSGLG